jgi:hypothetical protein
VRATGPAIMRGRCPIDRFQADEALRDIESDADALLADGGGLIFDLTTVCSRLRGKASAG